MSAKTPNQALSALLAEAGWTRTQLAQAVNRAGAEAGLTLQYDHSAVSHWVRGTVPAAAVQPVVCAVLTRRLRRPVTSAEAGFPRPDDDLLHPRSGDVVSKIVDLGRADMDPSRRGVLKAGLYSAALTVPGFSELADRVDAVSDGAGRTVRVGAGEVATVERMTVHIADILDELGAGHARPMAAAFLTNTVGTYLRADATPQVRASMLSAASDLVYLIGWMAMYEIEHGLGQSYYHRALDLAAAADDHVTYCRTLRGMALQAANLKHAQRALNLADAAAEAAPVSGPRLRAFLAGQQAHGAALVRDRRLAFARLRETEQALAKADGRNDHLGGYDASAYHFHVSSVMYALGDVPDSIAAMQQSQRLRPPTEKQGRAHANGVMAQRQLEVGHVEQAATTWHSFLDDYEKLSSARADDHFRTMLAGTRPYSRNPRVRDLRDRARALVATKA
ncbi:hypothetical protein [Kitasatospora purpeofusca]|uniref:hypothetical protein n=1 Tax=Kitasatospora purpeofusca TaxID=67352 RepID=UPI003866E6A6|nr:hypothetical protein OIP63_39275 [Kitasatospora purpeofusca]